MRPRFPAQASLFSFFFLFPVAVHSQVAQSIINDTMSCVSIANCDAPDRCISNFIYPQFKIRGDGPGYVLLGSAEPRPIRQFDNALAASEFLAVSADEQTFWLVVVPASIIAREDGAIQRDFHLHKVSQYAGTRVKTLADEFMKISCSVPKATGGN